MQIQQGYDEAVKQLKTILQQMEGPQPLSMEQYVQLAHQAKALIDDCRTYLTGVEQEINSIVEEPLKKDKFLAMQEKGTTFATV